MSALRSAPADGPLGFACTWERPRQHTWSGTPLRFFEALRGATPVADLGPDPSPLARRALKAAFTRRRDGRWVTTWKWSSTWDRLAGATVRRRADRAGCRAVVQVQDIAVLDRPYHVWQDLSIAALLAEADRSGGLPMGFEATSLPALRERRARQDRIYAHAAGLLPMSRWLAGSLEAGGIPAERIHPIHPGANVPPPASPDELRARVTGPPSRLLFVGRHFERKGGDAVLDAFGALRSRRPEVELTIIGPPNWPGGGPVPAGVRYLGPQPADAVRRALIEHDAFLMPSRFEAFGIALAEALCAGLPALARNAYAMPEIVTAGVDGVLVDGLGREELVEGMDALLSEDLRARTLARMEDARAYWSWDRAARDLLAAVDGPAA